MRPPLVSDWVDANLRRIRATHQFTLGPDDCWARRGGAAIGTGEVLEHGDIGDVKAAYKAQHEAGEGSWLDEKARAYYVRGRSKALLRTREDVCRG